MDFHDLPVIETERLRLRGPRLSDYPAFAAFFTSERAQYTRAPEIERWSAWDEFSKLLGCWAVNGYGCFILERKDTGVAIGDAGLWNPKTHPEPEIGWSLWSDRSEGKGFAHEAALAARDHARTAYGLDGLASFIDARNAGSIRLAERLGAVLEVTREGHSGPYHLYRHPKGGA